MATPTPAENTNLSPTETLTHITEISTEPFTEPLDSKPSDEPPAPVVTQTVEEQSIRETEKRKREDNPEEEGSGAAKRALHPLSKTSLCSFFRKDSSSCNHGETCRFAHGEEELRPRPDGSWDPTSEKAKEILKLVKPEENEVAEETEEEVMVTESMDDPSLDPSLDKCLVHLPRKWTSDNLKNYLDEKGVLYKTAKKKKGMMVGFLSFETADQVENAIKGLDGCSLMNKRIKVGNVIPRSFEKNTQLTGKQTLENVSAIENSNVSMSLDDLVNDLPIEQNDPNVDSPASKLRCARDAVTPLANMPYSSQLEHKKKSLEETLRGLTRNARKVCPKGVIPQWIHKSKEIGGLPCKVEGILESPLVNGYRNKVEFSLGYSLQGKPTVGFMLGNFREGVMACEEPMDCPNVSRIACKFASIFQEFLEGSDLPLWNRLNNVGFWRQLTVREGRKPDQSVGIEDLESNILDLMLIVQVCSTGVDDEIIKKEYQRMAQAFSEGATASSPPLPLTLLIVQDHQGISNFAPVDCPLQSLPIPKAANASGHEVSNNAMEPRIHDYISGLRFSISPTAFFQVNTLAAEKLYSLAGDWAGLGPDTLLFDICCGTGTIGLTLAHRVGMVVGVEMNASAVSDAYKNAEINGIKNCKFVCAKAEHVIGSLLKEYLDLPNKQEETTAASESNGSNERPNLDGLNHADTDVNIASSPQNNGEDLVEPSQDCHPEKNNGKIELPGALYKDVVAIVDPPRAGLHHVVIKALRTHPRIRRLVYISCNPESLVGNAIELCTPSPGKIEKSNKDNRAWVRNATVASIARRRAKSMPISDPFQPVKAMAVDLFPHTTHCEMVMLLER